ncbi:MAG: amidohydrolase family protein [Acidobacteriota bacterium]|nr:amidohydrolase family protein [Acidobacteriota bacterium]
MTEAGRPAEHRAVRGALLTGLPDGEVRYVPEGLLVFDAAGRIVHAGQASRAWSRADLVDGSPGALILPAFWDPHVHLPQLGIAGRHDEPLLEWLERRALPAESSHRDAARAASDTGAFFDALERAGTAGAGVFTSPVDGAARLALSEARRRGVPARIGPPLMDRGPRSLARPASAWVSSLRSLMSAYGAAVAVVPRFGPACTERLLAEAGRLARARGASVLGHVSETVEEVAEVRRLFHGREYCEVYDRAGLLGERTLLAHGIHLEDSELRVLARRRAWIVHCPTSNERLDSGRMPLERVRERGVRWCLGSDVGAGPELCLLHVMSVFLRIHDGRARTTAAEALWRATHAAADALGFGAEGGALVPGRRADFLVLDRRPPRARHAESAIRALVERGRPGRWDAIVGRLYRGGEACRRRGPARTGRS